MRRRSATLPIGLSAADLWLCAGSPWHPLSGLATLTAALNHPRCATAHLRELWRDHREAIQAAYAEDRRRIRGVCGSERPWVEDRLFLVDALHAR